MQLLKKLILEKRRRDTTIFSALLRFCVLVLFLVSCSKKEVKIPVDIIPKEKMVQVMMDIHLAEAQSQMRVPYNDIKSLKQSYYQFVFKKYHISYNDLEKSFNYYAAHPDVFSKIYDEVITGLSKKQAEAGRKQEKNF